MFKKMPIKKRITIFLFLLLCITLPMVSWFSFLFLKSNAEREILKQADLLISTMEATRNYVVRYTTPILEREVPGKFIIEGMADSFVNNVIFKGIGEDHPDYIYKNATINPLNPINKADFFETEKIEAFDTGKLKEEWRGFVDKDAGKFYAVMKPVRVRDQSCLSCHGDPDMAPEEVVKKFGKDQGYNWKVGSVVAVDAIYVPASVPLKQALTSLEFFVAIYSATFFLVIVIINFFLSRSVITPIKELVFAVDKLSLGDFKHELNIKTEDEIKELAKAFERLKVSVMRLMAMVKK